jgi:hypothetical protein
MGEEVALDGGVTSMGFETSKGVMHIWATVEGANGGKLYEKRTEESLEAYTKLLDLIVDRMVLLSGGSKWVKRSDV